MRSSAMPVRRTVLRLAVPLASALTLGALIAPGAAQAAGSAAAASTGKAPARTISASEQAAVKRLDHAAIAKTAKPLALPANRPLAGKVPAFGADGPSVKVSGALPKTARAGVVQKGLSLKAPGKATAATWDGSVWPGANTSNPNRQVGKLYFDKNPSPTVTQWSWCTASVINSENRSLLLTAGHCVWDIGNRRWYTNVWFYPGYQYGSSSLGVWSARLLSTTWNYYNSGASADDMAIVLVNRDSAGYGIVDRLGAHGIAFNQATGYYRTSFGYPITDSRWPGYVADGEDMRYCQGNDTYYTSGSFAGQLLLTCRMTGGASGGPWLHNVQSNWLGYANSVNSNKGGVGSAWAYHMFGPYFGSQESAVFQAYRNA